MGDNKDYVMIDGNAAAGLGCMYAGATVGAWGQAIPQLADEAEPSQEMRDSQLLYNEPNYIRFDDGDIHTLKSNGLTMKSGVYY